MNKEFVPYQESLELKGLGFDEPCFGSWETDYVEVPTYTHSISQFYKNSNHPTGKVTAPTFSQAFRFFREKYDLHVQIRKENYFQQSAYEYFHFDISRGQDTDITKQEELLGEIFEESSQDIPGNHLNDEKFSKLIFERKFAFKTYEEIESYCLDKLIEIVK